MRVLTPIFATLAILFVAQPAIAEELDWKRGKLGHLSPLIGTYRYEEVLTDPQARAAIAQVLPADKQKTLELHLQVHAAIDFISGHLVLNGNRPHHGGEDMAEVWLSVYDGSAHVVLMEGGRRTLFSRAERYGYLPVSLRRMLAAPKLEALYVAPADLRWVGGP